MNRRRFGVVRLRRKGIAMTDKKTTISKAVVALAGLLFLVLCWNAYRSVGGSGFDNVLAEPWGLVTLADVMLGGICMGVVIFANEKQKRVAILWTLPIFVLGHVVSVAWLLMRFLPQRAD
jgi:uncharacterized integral membrane protein